MITVISMLLLCATALGQEDRPARAPWGRQGPQVKSPEILSDSRVAFRIHAPKAETVRLNSGDMAGMITVSEMKMDTNGVWEVTVGPVEPGAYRYNFNLDGVSVVDPRNPTTSESNANTWSLVYVPGADWMDTTDVPHGAVAEVTYFSKTLNRSRRMHVYTPPGYDGGEGKFPVFYLLHGASDSDNSWSSIGRAGFILDNLIANKKAKPMIVVMPAGHTGAFTFGRGDGLRTAVDEFVREFNNDIVPLVEKRYRVESGAEHRAIAGLSMGGAQTLNIAIPNLDRFSHIGVFSSGIFGIAGDGPGGNDPNNSWEERNKEELDNQDLKKGLRLLWFGTGKDDFLLSTSEATVAMLKKHGFDVKYQETAGGHTWIVWRQYLREFAPLLFKD